MRKLRNHHRWKHLYFQTNIMQIRKKIIIRERSTENPFVNRQSQNRKQSDKRRITDTPSTTPVTWNELEARNTPMHPLHKKQKHLPNWIDRDRIESHNECEHAITETKRQPKNHQK